MIDLDHLGLNSSVTRSASSCTVATLAVVLISFASLVSALENSNPQDTQNNLEGEPDPTEISIQARRGPFEVDPFSVARYETREFGSATVYYPQATDQDSKGVIAISPGYTASESTIAWMGPRFASFGFVVITIDTNSRYDQPSARGAQLLAAIDYVINDARLAARVDGTRQAAIGHSMGGGGTLEAAKTRQTLEAVIGLTPYNLDKRWPEGQAAMLSIGAQNDPIPRQAATRCSFYESSTHAERRGYIELAGASHFAPTLPNTTIAKYTIAWLKRYVDNHTRYHAFLTPGPTPYVDSAISDYRIK